MPLFGKTKTKITNRQVEKREQPKRQTKLKRTTIHLGTIQSMEKAKTGKQPTNNDLERLSNLL